jgi:chromosome segregation ATPase
MHPHRLAIKREWNAFSKLKLIIAMENPTIQTDLAQILSRLEGKIDKLDEKIDSKIDKLDEKIDSKIDKLDEKIDSKIDKLDEKIDNLALGQAEIKGNIKALDERLSGEIKTLDTKTEQLNIRIGNVEFASRGILIGIAVVVLGGFGMFFWMSSKL